MRFKFTLFMVLCAFSLFAKHANPKVEALLDTVDQRLSEEALARYSEPGTASYYEALILALKAAPETVGSPSEDVFSPIQIYPNGETKVALQADKGWMSDDLMTLRGKDVKVFFYLEDGSLESTISAHEILVDRHTMRAVMRGMVSIEMGADTLQGNGALADLTTQYIRFLAHAKASTSRLSETSMTF